jgi:hypothetical protein
MPITDTSPEAHQVLIWLYCQMPAEKKLNLVFDAYETGRQLAMAGLRQRHPQASDKEIWRLWARQHLGEDLFNAVYGRGESGPDIPPEVGCAPSG